MNAILERFEALVEKLKGPALESLLHDHSLDDSKLEAIRAIARLPSPLLANRQEILDVCEQCTSGTLEVVYQVEGIGEDAASVLDDLL